MSKHLAKCMPYLQVLAETSDASTKTKYLRLFQDCILRAIREICVNLLLGNIDLTIAEKKRLKRYKYALRQLADPDVKRTEKTKILLRGDNNLLNSLIPPTKRRLQNV